ncbi:DUF2357 domain-containing protein [Bacillus tianshenii]|nr:DUF2357 domain-containing protein [Bacillus tianshenii]
MGLQINAVPESPSTDSVSALLPFQLYVKAGYETKTLSFTERREELTKHEISIPELTDLTLILETEANASVRIYWGCLYRISNGDDPQSWYALNQDTSEVKLFENGKGKEYPWRCGVYPVEIVWEGNVYYSCYRVLPKNLNSKQMEMIHEQLNEQLQGLIVDYLHQKQFAERSDPLHRSSFWRLLHWFQDNRKDLFSSLHMIMSNPHIEIGKVYTEESFPKRLDYRSARFENTLKGSVKRGERYYNRSLVKETDNEANRLVKFRLLRLIDDLKQGIRDLHRTLQEIKEEVLMQEEDLAAYKRRYELLLEDTRTPERHLLTRRNALYTKEHELNKKKKQLFDYEQVLAELEMMERQLTAVYSNVFWSRIRLQMPPRLLNGRHSGYQMFVKLWRESRACFDHTLQTSNVLVPVYHPSYLLYEYYVFFGAVRAVMESGFAPEKDLSGRIATALTGTGLPDGFTVTLTKDSQRIDIVYNQMIELKAQEALMKGTHFYLNSEHRKPDIRVDLYEEGSDTWKFVQTMIIEVKYSPLRNIVNPQTYGDTRATKQMDAYGNMKYIYNQNEFNHQPVHSVVCAFPGDDHSPVYRPFEYGHLLQFYPAKEEEIVGLKELRTHLQQMIYRI